MSNVDTYYRHNEGHKDSAGYMIVIRFSGEREIHLSYEDEAVRDDMIDAMDRLCQC